MSDSPTDSVRLYYGAASGQQRAALRRLEPEGVMISHATANNTPLDGDHETFVDCGGYHHMMAGTGEYADSDEAYLNWRHNLMQKLGTESLHDDRSRQTELSGVGA